VISIKRIVKHSQIPFNHAQKMAIRNNLKDLLKRVFPSRVSQILGMGSVETNKHAVSLNWYSNPLIGIPRDVNVSVLREFAKSIWVRMCVDTIIEEVTGLEWDVVPATEKYDENKLREVKEFFQYPNKDEDFKIFLKKLLKDILEIDAGVIVKTFNDTGKYETKKYSYKSYDYEKQKERIYQIEAEEISDDAELLEMYVVDGGSFLIQKDIYGRLLEDKPTYFQYSFLNPSGAPLPFWKREIVYFQMNPRTDSVYGFSPIQGIMNILESLMNATRFNKKIFEEYAFPSGVINLPGMSADELKQMRNEWQQKLKGKPHKILFTNTDNFEFKQLTMHPKDLEWLDGQKFYMKLVLAAFHVTQNELGFTDELNKHSSDRQDIVFLRKAIVPLVKLLESKFNNEIIPEFYKDGEKIEAKFKFFVEDIFMEELREKRWTQWIADGRRTINEWRKENGLEEVEWGDTYLKGGFTGFPQIINTDNQKKNEFKRLKKKQRIYITKDFSRTSDEILNAVKKYYSIASEEILKLFDGKKEVNEIIHSISNILNAEGLREPLRNAVKRVFTTGINYAEKQTGVQVGFQDNFMPLIERLTEEELYGYVMPDGSRWFGIQGVNEDFRIKLIDEIKEGMEKGESIRQISKRIEEKIDSMKGWESERIARTESNRIANLGSLNGFIRSGLKGKKEWISHLDDRTSDICKELDGKIVDLTDAFKLSNGSEFMIPPAHPNCRSTIAFIPE